jgi:hypothetical protein
MPPYGLKGVGCNIITECDLGFYSEGCFLLLFYWEYYMNIELPNQVTIR